MIFPSGGDLHLSKFTYQLGAAYIIGFLTKFGYGAKQFITRESFNVRECVRKISGYKPKIVGFTVYEKNFMQCALISNGLKSFNSDIITIFGGPTPTVQSQAILESVTSVDICVRNEGEETMLKLLSILSANNYNLKTADLNKINGITFRQGDKIKINADSNILLSNRSIKNYIDKYPSPYISEIIPLSKASPVGVITSRGCNQNCVYCNCTIMSKRNIFPHSIERVIDELAFIGEYKEFKGPVPINDDAFTIIPTRAAQICEQIIENNIKVPLSCITRCDTITEDLLNLMREAGIISVGFSLESAVPRVLRTIGKVSPPESMNLDNFEKEIEFIEKLKSMTSYAKKIGMHPVFVSIMVGLPGETIQDAQKTIELVKQLNIDFYSHNHFHIYKGTPIYQNHKKYGYKLTSLCKKNNIMLNNSYPFNVFKIRLAPQSATEMNRDRLDYNTLKILSFNPEREVLEPFFKNIIINTDVIKLSLVKWIQENLAINGTIIQIYSNKENYIKLDKKNESTLFSELMPTLYYEPYYWHKSDKIIILKSGKSYNFGEALGLLIKFKSTNIAMRQYDEGHNTMENVVCVDQTEIDIITIQDLLLKISKDKNGVRYLLDNKPLPRFQKLCRWTHNQANCQLLETAIIANDDSIRICWHSKPIGKVGISFSNLKSNIDYLQKQEIKRRNCNRCSEKETCMKCIFPYPLSSKEYCKYKKVNNTIESARIINSFNTMKDLLLKPINPLDF